MIKEYIYYPYVFKVEKKTLPPRVQALFEVKNMSRVIKKMIIMACNDMEDAHDMIKSIDYLICEYFFPLEANDIYWEIHHDLIKSLLEEEKKLFVKIGILEKDDVINKTGKGELPDLNQLFNRMTFYNFFAGWYSKDKELYTKSASYLAEQCFMDIAYFMAVKDSDDPLKDKEDHVKQSYLLEISNWLSMESLDEAYGDAAISFYEELIAFFQRYKVCEEKRELFIRLMNDVIADFKDVLNILLADCDVKMEELTEQVNICEAKTRDYEGILSYLNELRYMIKD